MEVRSSEGLQLAASQLLLGLPRAAPRLELGRQRAMCWTFPERRGVGFEPTSRLTTANGFRALHDGLTYHPAQAGTATRRCRFSRNATADGSAPRSAARRAIAVARHRLSRRLVVARRTAAPRAAVSFRSCRRSALQRMASVGRRGVAA